MVFQNLGNEALESSKKNKHTSDAIYCGWLHRVGTISAWHGWTEFGVLR